MTNRRMTNRTMMNRTMMNRTMASALKAAIVLSIGWIGVGESVMAQRIPNGIEGVDDLVNTEWLLEDLGGQGVVDRVQSTVRFGEDGRITGSGGCNRYFAGIEQEGDRLSVGVVGSTRMLCPPAVMDQEGRFFQALEAAEAIRLEGPYLYIDINGMDHPLRFTQMMV